MDLFRYVVEADRRIYVSVNKPSLVKLMVFHLFDTQPLSEAIILMKMFCVMWMSYYIVPSFQMCYVFVHSFFNHTAAEKNSP